jgi:glycerate 2-kinase
MQRTRPRSRPRALASPASLKGVLSGREAAAALAEGLRAWADVDELPVADGGEGTLDALHAAIGGEWRQTEVHDAFGRPRLARWLWRDGDAFVEAAEAIPLDPSRLDPLQASSRGLGELIAAVGRPRTLLVGLGGTANVDGGAGLREVLHELPAPTRVACDVAVPLVDAARTFAAQKGATPGQARELGRRLLAMPELKAVQDLDGAGAAGGLGAALAAMGAQLVAGAELVLDTIHFEPKGYDVVVTGEGIVDATTMRGKAPGEVLRRCAAAGVRCILFGGRVVEKPPGAVVTALSGDKSRARTDLVDLGRAIADTAGE